MTTQLTKDLFEGVSQQTIDKLKAGGVLTLESLAATPIGQVVELTGLGKETAEKVVKLALTNTVGFQKASDRRKTSQFISTGSKSLDALLGGGIETGIITELIGGYGQGKTQLIYTLSILAQLPPEQGGVNGKVAVIDTENTFREDRLRQICEARGAGIASLDNISVATALNTEHQAKLIKEALPPLCNEGVKLVCVDSMIGNFRNEYIGRGTLSDRQQKLGTLLGSLLRVAQTYDVAVVTTNQLIANPDSMYGPPDKPAGGHIMAHAGTQRVKLRRAKDNVRIAEIIDSPNLPPTECRFIITKAGIEDVGEE